MKLFVLLSVLSVSLVAAERSDRFILGPQDYTPSGDHRQLGAAAVDVSCFSAPAQLSHQALKECLVKLRSAAIMTYGKQSELFEITLPQLYQDLSKTTAPSDWDIHSPLLKVILDRLVTTNHLLELASRSEAINPGLWVTGAVHIEAIAQELSRRSRSMNTVSINILSDLIESAQRYRKDMLFLNRDGRPDLVRLERLYEDTASSAREVAQGVAQMYASQSAQIRDHDFLAPFESLSKDILGRSMDVRWFDPCEGYTGASYDPYGVHRLYYSYGTPAESTQHIIQFRSAIRRHLAEPFLAAMDVLPSTALSVCYDEVDTTTDRVERKNGDDEEYYDYLVGRLFIVLRGTISGKLAFRAKVFSNEQKRYYIRYTKLNGNGEVDKRWADYATAGVTAKSELERGWANHGPSHELLDNFIKGSPVENVATPAERAEISNNAQALMELVRTARAEKRKTLQSASLAMVLGGAAAQTWEGSSKALRTFAMLAVPESFFADEKLSDPITGKSGVVVDRKSLINALNNDSGLVDALARGDSSSLVKSLEGIKTIVYQKTSPELPPQILQPMAAITQSLLKTREAIKAGTPAVTIENAVTTLRAELMGFISKP